MKTKILKWDWKANRFGLLAIWGLSTLLIMFNMVALWLQIPVLSKLSNLIAVLALGSSVILSLVWVVLSFHHTMFGKYANLTASIPAKPSVIFSAKFIFGTLVLLATGVIFLVQAILISLFNDGLKHGTVQGIEKWWLGLRSVLSSPEILTLLIGCVLFQVFSSVISFYFAIVIGNRQIFWNLGKIGGTIVVLVLQYIATQVLALVGMLVPLSIRIDYRSTNSSLGFGVRFGFDNIFTMITDPTKTTGILPIGGLLLVLVSLGVWYWWTVRSLEGHWSLR